VISGNQSVGALTIRDRSAHHTSELPHYVKSLGLGIVAILIGLELSGWIGFALTDLHNHSDFPMYYRAAMLVRTGHASELYAPREIPYGYSHPAFEAIPFVVFTFFSPGWGYLLWTAVNIALLFATARLLSRPALNQVSPGGAIGIMLAFFPASFAVMNGQDSVLMTLLAVVSFRELNAGHPFRSGLVLGMTCFRFQFLLPCLAILVLWRFWQVLKGALLASALLMPVSLLVTGFHAQITYFHLIRTLGSNSYAATQRFATMGTLRILLMHSNIAPVFIPLCVLIVALTIYKARDATVPHKFLLAVLVACILNSYAYVYDMCILALPIIVFTTWLVQNGRYLELVVPLAVVALPLIILLTGGTKWLWLCGLMAPVLLTVMLRDWSVPALAWEGSGVSS
jgi:glycosyl transferase family 87